MCGYVFQYVRLSVVVMFTRAGAVMAVCLLLVCLCVYV